jgi:transglycosylase-like protein with SLT domain
MHRFCRFLLAGCFAANVLFCSTGFGQMLFSYMDESGVRILTNIPPKGLVLNLQTTGVSASPTQPFQGTSSKRTSRYDPIIEKYAAQYKLDPSLIRSMIATESAFDEKAVSPKGARGLMQLMPATAARVGVKNIFDPEQNIRGGTLHMRSLLDTFNNNLPLSLAAYNAGENLVLRLGRIPNIRETHDYVKSVTQRYGKSEIQFHGQDAASGPSMFRFTDDQGVLHLTNIPPVERSENSTAGAQP